jgi:hypothetical protein
MPTVQAYIPDGKYRTFSDWREAWAKRLDTPDMTVGELLVALSNDKRMWPR